MIKRNILFAIVALFCSVTLQAQNYNWITPNKPYLKLYIASDGIYRIYKTDFTNAGIDVSSIDPRTFKVMFKGIESSCYVEGQNDGVFDNSDFIDFYGMRNYGGPQNVFNESGVIKYQKNEFYNELSDTSVYWIDWGGALGKRFSDNTFNSVTPYTPNYFFNTIHREFDKYYSLGEQASASDYRRFTVDKFQGEDWYWNVLGNTDSMTDTDSLADLNTGTPVTCKFKIFAYSNNAFADPNEHFIEIRINNNLISTINSNDFDKIDTTVNFSSSVLNNNNNTVNIKYYTSPSLGSSMNIDYYEFTYPKTFKIINSSRFTVDLSGSDTTSNLFSVKNYSNLKPVVIYDIRNNIRINNYTSTNDTLKFTAKRNANIELVNSVSLKRPLRIVKKSVPNLVNTPAQYVIIYNSIFSDQAEQIKNFHISHDTLISIKTDIEDIYDVFNYGMEDQSAIRSYLKNMYDNLLPRLKYTCLFGRGSLDPKANTAGSIYKNLIPVYGNPNSDNYYVNFNLNSRVYFQNVAVGRLPAYTVDEAEIIKNKIINYSLTPLADWTKTVDFVTGGVSGGEQSYFQSLANTFSNTYIYPKPISDAVHKIFRVDGQGGAVFNFGDSIVNEFNRGAIIFNYNGHAGNGTWDNGLEDPSILNNGDKLPFLFSMTCFTVKNSEASKRGFGEKFFIYPNKGAIGYVGCTGWAFSSATYNMNAYCYRAFKDSLFRSQGDLLRTGTQIMSADSSSFASRITLNCFNLLGDPASVLISPVHPEFSVTNERSVLSDINPVLNENLSFKVFPKNYGISADSCKIKLELLKNNLAYITRDTIVRNFGFKDSVGFNFILDSLGLYSIRTTMDPDNWFPSDSKIDNILNIPVNLRNTSFYPLKPINNSIVYGDSVEFTGLNPDNNPKKASIQLLLQLDTNQSFANPLIFQNSNITGVVTNFKTAIPFPDTNRIYFWRTRSVINGVNSEWSQSQKFVYKPLINSLSAGKSINKMITVDSLTTILLSKQSQYDNVILNNMKYDSVGFNLSNKDGYIKVFSLGNNGEETSYFIVNSSQINIGQRSNPGLNIVKVRKIDGKMLELKNFSMSAASSSDSVINYINTFDANTILLVGKAHYFPAGVAFSPALRTLFKSMGSIYADSVDIFNNFNTWSFIVNGSAHSEAYHRYPNYVEGCPNNWCGSTAELHTNFKNIYGNLTLLYGPSQKWNSFSWEKLSAPGNSITFDISGRNINGSTDVLYSGLTSNQLVLLDNINAQTYPNLNVKANFYIDTASSQINSAYLTSVKLDYIPPAELIVDKNSITSPDSITSTGRKVSYNYTISNAGFSDISKYATTIYYYDNQIKKIISVDSVSVPLLKNQSRSISKKFIMPKPVYSDPSNPYFVIYVEAVSASGINDYFSYNNTGSYGFRVKSFGPAFEFNVYADGMLLKNSDYVSSKPEIKIELKHIGNDGDKKSVKEKDDSIEDSSGTFVSLKVDKKDFTVTGNKMRSDNSVQQISGEMKFYPQLSAGTHNLNFILRNSAGESLDSISYNVEVSDVLLLKDLYNFPNPASNTTKFIFNIGGSVRPGSAKIKIYTVSGKVIKIIDFPASIGYNQVDWDLKDSDGDQIANGIYLYKMILNDDTRSETGIQKLVVLK
ncbi:hypothetical protein BH10BAC5_BH10BAC5_14560 [soil metagenome]